MKTTDPTTTDPTTIARRRFLAGTGAAALGLALAPGAVLGGSRRPVAAGTYFDWAELGEGLHAVADLQSGGNVMVITRPNASLLIDTKYPALAGALLREGGSFGHPITHALNTHHHGDHTGGNAIVRAQVETFYAHENALPRIEGQLPRFAQMAAGGARQVDRDRETAELVMADAQAAAEAAAEWTAESFAPTEAIGDGRTEIDLDGLTLHLHHFGPGHTDNDLAVLLPEANVLHTGDLCFHGLHPFFDQTAGVTCQGWIAVMSSLLALCDDATVVVPGHGEITDRAGLARQKDYLDALWEKVFAEAERDTPKEQVVKMSWDFMDGLGFEQIRARAIGAVYDEAIEDMQ